ncbi:MAG: hypothetical protein V1484_02060, partial [bacterium]
QKSQSMRSIIDNLSFMMEDMSRNLRTGVNYHCIDGTPNGSDAGTNAHSCANGGGIAFKPASGGSRWVYYVGVTTNGYGIFKSVDGATVQLTPEEIVIDTGASGFSVLGAEPPPDDNQQPFVTIKLVGTITFKNVVTPFSIQTSVSQRIIDVYGALPPPPPPPPSGFSATGGTITYSGGYTIHTFTSSDTFSVTGSGDVEYLVIAGGGGGGGQYSWSGGGSGGAGGYRSSVVGENSGHNSSAEPKLAVTTGNYSVVVGNGGAGGANQASGGYGGNSSFSTITSIGGGAGPRPDLPGNNGGSGSGSNGVTPVGYGMAGQGYDGLTTHYGGGAGGTPTGLSSSITGTPTTRAVGGPQPRPGETPINASANTGNGGEPAAWNYYGTAGNGGSGIVIVRYLTP